MTISIGVVWFDLEVCLPGVWPTLSGHPIVNPWQFGAMVYTHSGWYQGRRLNLHGPGLAISRCRRWYVQGFVDRSLWLDPMNDLIRRVRNSNTACQHRYSL